MSVVFRDARASAVALALMIVIAVCLAYASGLKAPFVLDDGNSITENKSIQSLWPIWPVVVYEHREGRTIDGRPLLNLSLALNLAATGMVPAGFRAVNIFIHCVNALLLWGIARHLLSRPALPQPVQDMAGEIAFAGALLWAVHPLGTTAVTYVIQRAESLAALMMLATTASCIRGMTAADDGRRSWDLPVTAILSILAGTAKETSVAIPFATVLIDRALLSCSWRGTARHWPWHFAAAASWTSVTLLFAAGGRGSSAGINSASPWLYLLTQSRAIWLYLVRIVWPQGLVFDYGDLLSTGLGESIKQHLFCKSGFSEVGHLASMFR